MIVACHEDHHACVYTHEVEVLVLLEEYCVRLESIDKRFSLLSNNKSKERHDCINELVKSFSCQSIGHCYLLTQRYSFAPT